jgi:hypothetical protein
MQALARSYKIIRLCTHEFALRDFSLDGHGHRVGGWTLADDGQREPMAAGGWFARFYFGSCSHWVSHALMPIGSFGLNGPFSFHWRGRVTISGLSLSNRGLPVPEACDSFRRYGK